jgi:CDP-diacylglycerol--serine O-phosphatidyltransferase
MNQSSSGTSEQTTDRSSSSDGGPAAPDGAASNNGATSDNGSASTNGPASTNGSASSNGAATTNGAESRDTSAGLRDRLSAYREERREERPPRRPAVAVPSFFTLLNLLCGFLALTQVLEATQGLEAGFTRACWLIVLAGFFDALDGLTARLTDAQSEFGVQLDSLSDVVSFGVAPAFLVWAYGLSEFDPLGMLVAALPALCGAVRLARYNVGFDGEKDDHFSGLPIPAQAVTLVVLILTLEGGTWFGRVGGGGNLPVLIPVVCVLAVLMVSNVRFGAFPKPTPGYAKAHPYKIGAYVVGMALLPFLQELALLLFLAGYIAVGIVSSTYRLGQAVMNAPVEAPGSDA